MASRLLQSPLSVVNVGLESFNDSIRASDATQLVHAQWRPAGDGDPLLAWQLAQLMGGSPGVGDIGSEIDAANGALAVAPLAYLVNSETLVRQEATPTPTGPDSWEVTVRYGTEDEQQFASVSIADGASERCHVKSAYACLSGVGSFARRAGACSDDGSGTRGTRSSA